jgi:hypothetical protein
MKIFKSECKELIDAHKAHDSVELLDGAIDVFVTLSGLMQIMEHLGFGVEKGTKRICDNNLEKYIDGETCTDISLVQPPNTTHTYNDYFDVHVFKDKDGKVKKPIGFKPVELQDLVPDGIWNN